MNRLHSLLSILVGFSATLLSGLFKRYGTVIDASFDNYGLPLPWLVYGEGFGAVKPVGWTFNLLFFILDAVLYASITYVLLMTLAKAKLL